MKNKKDINEIVNETSFLKNNLKTIHELLETNNHETLNNFVKSLHNADISEIIQNLDVEIRF